MRPEPRSNLTTFSKKTVEGFLKHELITKKLI